MGIFADKFAKSGYLGFATWTAADKDFDVALSNYIEHGGSFDRAKQIIDRRKELAGKGHADVETQFSRADSRQPNPEPGGHCAVEDHCPRATSAQVTNPETDGHSRCETHLTSAVGSPERKPDPAVHPAGETHSSAASGDQALKAGGGGHRPSVNHSIAAPASPASRPYSRPVGSGSATVRTGFNPLARSLIHNHRPSAESMRAGRAIGHTSVLSIFERTKLPNGRRYADIRADELVGLAGEHISHASLLLRANDRAVKLGKMGPRYTVKDLYNTKEFALEVQMAGMILEGPMKAGILIEPNGAVSFVRGENP